MFKCPPPLKGCKHGGRKNKHHKYWPASDYRTPLERAFWKHPDNIIYNICMCQHDLYHLRRPPAKPSEKFMRQFLGYKEVK